jgi:hypothetical protein
MKEICRGGRLYHFIDFFTLRLISRKHQEFWYGYFILEVRMISKY